MLQGRYKEYIEKTGNKYHKLRFQAKFYGIKKSFNYSQRQQTPELHFFMQ